MQFNAAESMAQPGSAMGATMGAAMGAGIGFGMGANAGPWGANAAPPPPPPPAARVWHVADNGATKGPFSDADLATMAASGALTRTTQVWTPGQDAWKAAADTELARLFAMVPPPPPPPGQ
jgi:hypothetical protein